jgi:hypothetical protein
LVRRWKPLISEQCGRKEIAVPLHAPALPHGHHIIRLDGASDYLNFLEDDGFVPVPASSPFYQV